MEREPEKDAQTIEDEKLARGCWGCLIALVSMFLLPYILGGLFYLLFALSSQVEIEWHGKGYYLQYESTIGERTGHHLLCQVGGERVEILPHVYGYAVEKGQVYFASSQGYAVVHLKSKEIDIILLSEDIPKVESEKITYHSDFSEFSVIEQEKLLSIPRELVAYMVTWGPDGYCIPIGDGRFQYENFSYIDGRFFTLWTYGFTGDYDFREELLPRLNGYLLTDNEIFYATSSQGYAIVDGPSGTCRIYFTDPELAEKDYQKDIYVLDSFEEFSLEEQEILRRVEREGL